MKEKMENKWKEVTSEVEIHQNMEDGVLEERNEKAEILHEGSGRKKEQYDKKFNQEYRETKSTFFTKDVCPGKRPIQIIP